MNTCKHPKTRLAALLSSFLIMAGISSVPAEEVNPCLGAGAVSLGNNVVFATAAVMATNGHANRLVYDQDNVTPLVGTNWVVQLYYAPGEDQAESCLIPVGGVCTFRMTSTSVPGTWTPSSSTRTIDVCQQEVATMQIRVWNSHAFSSYESAAASGGVVAKSPLFNYTVPMVASLPKDYYMEGLQSITLAPANALPAPPTITMSPTNCVSSVGSAAVFRVMASGASLSYQWRKESVSLNDGASISGATAANLTLNNVQMADAGGYSVVASNAHGMATSSVASLTVYNPGVIGFAQANYTESEGVASVLLTVKRTGGNEGAVSVRYATRNGTALTGVDYTTNGGTLLLLNGETETTFAVSLMNDAVPESDETFSVVLYNASGGAGLGLTNAMVTIVDDDTEAATAPAILTQPGNQVVAAGSTVVVGVAAGGTAPLAYRWRKDGTNLYDGGPFSGATTTALTIADFQTANQGPYQCVVTNIVGVAVSSNAYLTLDVAPVPPSITEQPVSRTNSIGSSATFSVNAATNAAGMRYRWHKNGAALADGGNMAGAASRILTIRYLKMADAGGYGVLVSNMSGSVTSEVASLVVRSNIFDLSGDFSLAMNPNGAWSYGWKPAVPGSMTLHTYARYSYGENGVPLENWARYANDPSMIFKNSTANTMIGVGGQAVYPPGTLGLFPGVDGREDAYVVARFTLPAGMAGYYQVQAFAANACNGFLSGDADFHVVRNGQELMGTNVPAGTATLTNTASYSDVLPLAEGDTLEFLVGRGADGNDNGSGLKVRASLERVAMFEPTVIVAQPQSVLVRPGQTAAFAVIATGLTPLSYQWRKDGVALTDDGVIAGATSANLTLSSALSSHVGDYSVVVSNISGLVTSAVAELTIYSAPVITRSPQDLVVRAGATATFTWAAVGPEPMVFAWYRVGAAQPEAIGTRSNLVMVGVTPSQAGAYQLVVSNLVGCATSEVATLTVAVKPDITSQPVSRTNAQGTTATFHVVATGGALSYQWKLSGSSLTDGGNVRGAQTDTLTILSVNASHAGTYTVTVSNPAGSVSSVPRTLTSIMPPAITAQPKSQRVVWGTNVVFKAMASGTAPLDYQWQHNGQPIADGSVFSGTTTPNLLVSSATTNQAGAYSLVVRNTAGTVASSNAVLVIMPDVEIVSPLAAAVITNPAVTLTGTASDRAGVASVRYSLNGSPWAPVTGLSNWTTAVNMITGTNVFQVKATSGAGIESDPVERRYFMPVLSRLTVTALGTGTVVPNLNGQYLYVGQNYNMTAIPGAGQSFSNWVGDDGLLSTSKRVLFVMKTNLSLTATFVPDPFLARGGIYNGLFYETNGVRFESSGYLQIVVRDDGVASGQIWLEGKKASIAPGIWLDGRGGKEVHANGHVYRVNVAMDMTPGVTNVMTGTVSANGWEAPFWADRSGNGNGSWPALTGVYTYALTNGSDGSLSPGGDGVGKLSVSADWSVRVRGKLSDDTTVTPIMYLSRSGHWPFYASLYGGRGAVLGWMTFTNHNGTSVEGALSWIKSAGAGGARYAGGFTNEVYLLGSRFLVPAAGTRLIAVTNGVVELKGAYLSPEMTNVVQYSANNGVKVTGGPSNRLALSVSGNGGTVSGSFYYRPGSATQQTINGVVLQGLNQVRGYYLGTNATGSILLRGQ